MNWQNCVLKYSPELANQIILLEGKAGESRRTNLQQCLKEAQQNGASTWLLSCDRYEGGPWAGLNSFLNSLIAEIQAKAPDLITKYDYELVHVLPALRRTVSVRYLALTDVAPEGEQVSNHPADRVVRILHGIIDLLRSWYKRTADNSPWVIACDHYDCASTLVQRFFVELIRRCGRQMKLTLLLATDVEESQTVVGKFHPSYLGQAIRLDGSFEPISSFCPQKMRQLAQALAQDVGEDLIEQEIHLPRLIYYWLHSDQPICALEHQIKACLIYTRRAFYEDGLFYGEAALAQIELHYPKDNYKRLQLVEKMYLCYVALDQPVKAFHLLEHAMRNTSDPYFLGRGFYLMGMLHARYLPCQDLIKAEEYLERGLQLLKQADIPKQEELVHTTTNRRGLALIRYRQGKRYEAAELCWSCYEQLNTQLGSQQCLLPKALLLFNVAYTYAAIGPYERAISYLTAALEIDSNYSEYYNDRGNVYFKMGCLQDAINDYLKAIELSPPHHESWTNLGQCYRLMGQMSEAVTAYSNALDIDPNQSLALIGRAQSYEALEQLDAALIDYSAAIDLDSNQPLVLANRAILHYNAGRLLKALEDLNQAITLSPQVADLYQNRAITLIILKRFEEAVQDLKTYLRLKPNADDRFEVEEQILSLQSGN